MDSKKRKKKDKKEQLKGLPSSKETEKTVLGAILKNNSLFFTSFLSLEEKDFYFESHKIVFNAIKELIKENDRCDSISLKEYLKGIGKIDEAGGEYYIISLIDGIPYLESIDHYVKFLKQKSIKRELYYLADEIIHGVTTDLMPHEEILEKTQIGLLRIAEGGISKGFVKVGDIHHVFLEELDKKSKGYNAGLATGFIDIDNRTGGLQKQNLVVVAGRPGMGKTAFALNIAYNIAKRGGCVGFFSLEMSKEELYKRLVSMESGVPSNKIRDAILTKDEKQKIFDATNKISESNIFVDETGGITITELTARAKQLKDLYDCDLFAIDYIQLMNMDKTSFRSSRSRVEEVSTISRGLKEMAKELNVPVIAISQLSRAVEQRPGARRPRLSDLRESGAIEQDADLVMFVYRPEIYYPEEEIFQGVAEIIIAKHRNGPIGSELLTFLGALTKFTNTALPNKDEILEAISQLG